MFILRKTFWLTLVKLFGLVFVGYMIWVQIPELWYDLGRKRPIQVNSPEDLVTGRFRASTFVSVRGTPSFDRAFVYRRYGLSYTYFNLESYEMRLVLRTYDKVTEEWKSLNRFIGKLRPFSDQPFSYRIRDIYREKFDVDVPAGAFFLALDDVPRLSGWQVGAFIFAGTLWVVMFYFFFLFRREGRRQGLF